MNNDRYHIKENAEFLKDLGKKYGNVLNRTTMINFVNDAKKNHQYLQALTLVLWLNI